MVKTNGKKRSVLKAVLLVVVLATAAALWVPVLWEKFQGSFIEKEQTSERELTTGNDPAPDTREQGTGEEPQPGPENPVPGRQPPGPEDPSGAQREPGGDQTEKPAGERDIQAEIAIIIDDVGYEGNDLTRFSTIGADLTFSVLPFLKGSREQAWTLYDLGYEIMLHIPMEPMGYPSDDPGPGALFLSDPTHTVEHKLNLMLDQLPVARGANNHMGSRATSDPALMERTMSFLSGRGLYFVDSRTTGDSRAYEAAVRYGIPAVNRDIFLDNRDDPVYVAARFEELKDLALKRGRAVGIGHVHSAALARVLREQIPGLEQEGIRLVFASRLAQ
jgi:hypothetical protein